MHLRSKRRGYCTVMTSSPRAEVELQSSMAYWFPRVADLPVPRTVFVALPVMASSKWAAEGVPTWYVEQVARAASFTEYPLFMRTDYASGKHRWREACYVPDKESLGRHIVTILEENESDESTGTPYKWSSEWLVLRDYIPMETIFEAFSGRMPINHEHRYFIKDGVVQCGHPYWPPAAFKREEVGLAPSKLPTDWRARLSAISLCEHAENQAVLSTVASRFDGWWSVDFSKAKSKDWYLIDMGRAEISFHWPSCPNAPAEMKERYGEIE